MDNQPHSYNFFGKTIEYKWIVLSVTTIGALMAAIDSTIVVLALPDMMVKLHADLIEMIWVIMGYILVSTVLPAHPGACGGYSGPRAHVQPGLRHLHGWLNIMRLSRAMPPS
jgi:MFS family permease